MKYQEEGVSRAPSADRWGLNPGWLALSPYAGTSAAAAIGGCGGGGGGVVFCAEIGSHVDQADL